MFQFPGFASVSYVFTYRYLVEVGCPIRKSWTITGFVTSSRLIADLHVLHRL